MKNYHILGIALFTGVIIGAALSLPARAGSYKSMQPIPYGSYEVVVASIDKTDCTLTDEGGDEFFYDCTLDEIHVGQTVTVDGNQVATW
ncbi:hypothetical protein ACK16A_11050 [Klebsiella michiganensis]|uniref:hypothetical protein n=1 Tax=Klebsiella michiganensis TaxID=1134687 RepID=UPI0039707D27